ncbi:MAG: tetratricopeptide (TPR) repeat protein, partial [Myxococcota bacterium]
MTKTSRLERPTAVFVAMMLLAMGVVAGGWPAVHSAPPVASDPADRKLLETYRSMLRSAPDQEYAFRRLLEVSHTVGGLTGLIALYDDEVTEDPKRYAAWMLLGHLNRTGENETRALEAYQRASALKPQSAGPYLARGQLHRQLRQWAPMLKTYDLALGLITDRTQKQQALRAAAEGAIEAEQTARAQAYFEALVQTEPGNLFLRMEQAATLARLDQKDEALTLWQAIESRARGQLQHLVIAWKEIAELQMRLDRFADAEATWRKALTKVPAGHWDRQTFVDGLIAVYRRQDRLRELLAEFEPKRAHEMRVTVARLYEELADDVKALAAYRQAIKLKPSDSRSREAALRLLERIGSPEEVIAAYKALIRAQRGDAGIELKLAELYFHHGKKKDGQTLLTKISRRYPSDPGVHQHIIDMWMRFGSKGTRTYIESEYKLLLRLEPGEAPHVTSLGEYYWTIDNKSRALSTWGQLVRMGDGPGEGHLLLAEVYADHDLPQALDQFEKALASAPDNPRMIKAYAIALEKAGRYDAALKTWERVLGGTGASTATADLDARDARRHVLELWERRGRLSDEITQLEARFSGTPPDTAAGRFLADAYLQAGRAEDAERVLLKLRGLDPTDRAALVALETVYTRQNRLAEAIAVLEALAKINSRAAVDYIHRAADLALSMGDEQLALRYTRQVVELNPADPVAQARVGALYQRMGYRAEAAEALRQALVLDPRAEGVKFKLAALYRDLGKNQREEQLLSEILRDARDPSDAMRAGRRLVQLAITTGRLQRVEQVLEPLVSSGGRTVYLKLLIEVYAHQCYALQYAKIFKAKREADLEQIGARALKPLLDALANPDVGLRSRSLAVLELTHPKAAAAALSRMTQEGDSLTQVHAAVALGRIGSPSAVAALARLTGHTRDSVRAIAIWALGLVDDAGAVTVLSDRMRRATASERVLIGLALGRSAHPDAAPVAARLVADRSNDVRGIGLWALGRIADPRSVGLLNAWLTRGDITHARLAAWGLGRIGTAEAHQKLVEALFVTDAVAEDLVWRALAHGPLDRGDTYVASVYERLLVRDQARIHPGPARLLGVSYPADANPNPTSEQPISDAVWGPYESALSTRVSRVLRQAPSHALRRMLATLTEGEGLSFVVSPDLSLRASGQLMTLRILASHAAQFERLLGQGTGDETVEASTLALLARWSVLAPDVVRAETVRGHARALLSRANPDVLTSAFAALATVGSDPAVDRVLDRRLGDLDPAHFETPQRVALADLLVTARPVQRSRLLQRLLR